MNSRMHPLPSISRLSYTSPILSKGEKRPVLFGVFPMHSTTVELSQNGEEETHELDYGGLELFPSHLLQRSI